MCRVIAYIDGFNLYHGLKQHAWRQFYWIDPYRLIQNLLAEGHTLEGVKYFTARVRAPADKRQRQDAFLEALRVRSDAEIIYGKFYKKPKTCHNCGRSWQSFEEKMTDSAIAANLVADAFRDCFDTAVLVGGDTDIVPAIKMVRRWLPQKRMVVWFPPVRKNDEVARACDDSGDIKGNHLESAVMPDEIDAGEGLVIRRPDRWR